MFGVLKIILCGVKQKRGRISKIMDVGGLNCVGRMPRTGVSVDGGN